MKSLLIPALVVLMAGGLVGQPITDLTVNERFGLARENEPVRMGVPLAVGVVKEVGQLALTDSAGKPMPAQFTEAMKWPDGSLRWVHVVFNASVPANGKTVVTVMKIDPLPVKKLNVQASADVGKATDGAITVENGFVKLAVKGAGFNVIDSLALDPAGKGNYASAQIKPHDGGIVADIDGKVLKSSLDKEGKVVVEEQGSECVVLKATGHLVSGEAKALAYTCRIHVFAGTPMIKVDLSYTNDQGKDATDKLVVKDLSVVLPTTLMSAAFTVGGEEKALTGSLAKGESAEIMADSSERSVIKSAGKEIGQAKNKATKPLTIGWIDAAGSDSAGLAVSLRWFWQMFPKSLQVSADGTVKIGLYSALASPDKPLDVYMGQGRTHYLTLLPHGKMTAEALNTAMSARQVPLRAVASPQYYCRTSKAFGLVADSDPAIYPADVKEIAANYDATLKKSLDAIVKKIDNATYVGSTRDSYGYNYWGDLFHWSNVEGSVDPKDHLWESNYYDYPWACCLQFARTGEQKYLDVTETNGLHLGDVFMCKWDPDEMYRGACRYSPPADEVALDTTGKFTPYRSVEFNHHKAQSILARYLLLGDLQAKDHFLLALNNALKDPEESWGQCRGPGAKLATLYEGFQLTGDPACLTVMKRIMTKAEKMKDTPKSFSKQGGGGYFMMGIAREGMLYWWQQTADAEAVATVKSITDFLLDGSKLQGPQDAYPLAFCFRSTGEAKYRDAAVRMLKKSSVEMRPKGFGMAWRSTPYAWYYLSNLAESAAKAAPGNP